MKIYACYTTSHRPLLEQHFLPSVPEGFDVVLRRNPQSCPSGIFRSPNWAKAMQDKVRLVLDALAAEKKPFIVSDVDVRFYSLKPADVETLLGNYTIAYQLDEPLADHQTPSPCAGFAIMRPCESNVRLYSMLLLAIPLYEFESEQSALSGCVLPAMKRQKDFQVGYLPPESFWNIRHGVELLKKNRLALHHANWVTGIEAKLDLLRKFQMIVGNQEES
jgi:hypothetical protein